MAGFLINDKDKLVASSGAPSQVMLRSRAARRGVTPPALHASGAPIITNTYRLEIDYQTENWC